jgi:hypothetical protein
MRLIKVFKLSELPEAYIDDILNRPSDMDTDGHYWQTYAGSFVEEVEENGWKGYVSSPKELEKYREADKVFFAAGCTLGEQILIEQG